MPVSEVENTTPEPVSMDGIHIMANGDVMAGDGTVLPGASIRADGMIVLSSGQVIEPAMDLRK